MARFSFLGLVPLLLISCGSQTFRGDAKDGGGDASSDAGPDGTSAGDGGQGDLLVGSSTYLEEAATKPAGEAIAYQFAATATGTIGHLDAFIDSGTDCPGVILGVYDDALGHAGNLITRGKLADGAIGWSSTVATPNPTVTAGTLYWVALLCPAPTGGTLHFRDSSAGPMPSEHDVDTNLTDLPPLWSPGIHNDTDGPVSAYAAE